MKNEKIIVALLVAIFMVSAFAIAIPVTTAKKDSKESKPGLRKSDNPLLNLPTDEENWIPIVPPEPVGRPLDEEAKQAREILVYDVETKKTKKILKDFTKSDETVLKMPESQGSLPSDLVLESVILPDDDCVRITPTTSYPWRTICKLRMWFPNGQQYMGSGFIIDNYHVITAGHCVYDSSLGGMAEYIEVIPALDGGYTPFYHAWATKISAIDWQYSGSYRWDFGILTLDRNIGFFTGWMGREYADPSDSIYTGILNTAGYPGDLDGGGNMYFDSDWGAGADGFNHWYYMDTEGGQSGSPVWYFDGTSRYVLSVHAYGAGWPLYPDSNMGTRFSDFWFGYIDYIRSQDTPPTDYANLIDDGQVWSGFSPTPVWPGVTPFSVWSDTSNIGTAASGGFQVSYYASTDTSITASDYLIGTVSMTSIPPFTYADSDWSGTFPIIPAGTYYVGWIIDSTDTVPEPLDNGEGNNVAYKDSYQLTVESTALIHYYTNPNAVGSITFNGDIYEDYQSGIYIPDDYTITANAPTGYDFHHWEYDNIGTPGVGVYVPNIGANPTTASVSGDGWLKAVFEALITFRTEPSNIGSISYGGSIYSDGQSIWEVNLPPDYTNIVAITANPSDDYIFSHWEPTGQIGVDSTMSSTTDLTVNGPGVLTAVFERVLEINYILTTDYVERDWGECGDTMVVLGSGATSGESVNLYWDYVNTVGLMNNTIANPDGTFEVWFNVPEAVNGSHYLWVIDTETAEASRSGPFTVIPSITLDVETGPVGTVVTVSGSGFTPGHTVDTITINGEFCGTFGVLDFDEVGKFTGGFVISNVENIGIHEITLKATNGLEAKNDFLITGLAEIVVSPNYGIPGATITVKGYNFTKIAGTDVNIDIYDGAIKVADLVTAETDADGKFEDTFIVPAIDFKSYDVVATDGYGVDANDTFKIDLIALIINPTYGEAGTKISITGIGFTPGVYNLTFGDKLYAEYGVVGVDEIITDLFYVPNFEPRTYDLTVIDTNEIEVTALFSLTESTYVIAYPAVAPNDYNISLKGYNFADSVGAVDFVIYNSTHNWPMNVFQDGLGTDPVETDFDGNFTGWWIVPVKDTISLGDYTINITGSKGILVQVPFSVVAERVDVAPRKAQFVRGDIVAFDIECHFKYPEAYIEIYNPSDILYWSTDPFIEDYWMLVEGLYTVPYYRQTAGGNPILLAPDAPLGTWSYIFYETDTNNLTEGTFTVNPSEPTTFYTTDYLLFNLGHTNTFNVSDDDLSNCTVEMVFQNSTEENYLITLTQIGEEGGFWCDSAIYIGERDGFLTAWGGAPVGNQAHFFWLVFSTPEIFYDGDTWNHSYYDVSYEASYVGEITINDVSYSDCLLLKFDSTNHLRDIYFQGIGEAYLAKDVGIIKFTFNKTDGNNFTAILEKHGDYAQRRISGYFILDSNSPAWGYSVGLSNAVNVGYDATLVEVNGSYSLPFYGSSVILRYGPISMDGRHLMYQHSQEEKINGAVGDIVDYNLTAPDVGLSGPLEERPPELIIWPQNVTIPDDRILFNGRAISVNGIKNVSVNGELASGLFSGIYYFWQKEVTLTEGMNDIQITAYDNGPLQKSSSTNLWINYAKDTYDGPRVEPVSLDALPENRRVLTFIVKPNGTETGAYLWWAPSYVEHSPFQRGYSLGHGYDGYDDVTIIYDIEDRYGLLQVGEEIEYRIHVESSGYWASHDVITITVGSPDHSPPWVESVSPMPEEQYVPVNSSIDIFFNEQLNHLTLTPDNILLNSEPFDGEIKYDFHSHKLTLIPGYPFQQNSKVSIELNSGITDYAGNNLTAYSWDFYVYEVEDLILEGNATLIIENCVYNHSGNIIVRENASLILRNATLALYWSSFHEYDILFQGSSYFESFNSTITDIPSSYDRGGYYIFMMDGSFANITSSRFHYPAALLDARGLEVTVKIRDSYLDMINIASDSNIEIYNSQINVHIYSGSPNVTIWDSENIGQILIHFSGSTYAELSLQPGYHSYWSLQGNETISNCTKELTVFNSTISRWSLRAYNRADINIKDSILSYFESRDEASFNLENVIVRDAGAEDNSSITLRDSSIRNLDTYDFSKVQMVNTSIDIYGQVNVFNESEIYVGWYLDATAIKEEGPIEGAIVEVYTMPEASLIDSKLTNEDGLARFDIWEKVLRADGADFVNNYNISCEYQGVRLSEEILLTGNYELEIDFTELYLRDWPMFHRDQQNSGFTYIEVTPPLELSWKTKIYTSYSHPVIANGTVYVGSQSRYLYSIDAETGAINWQFDLREPNHPNRTIKSAPAIYGDYVIVNSWDQVIFAVHRNNGSLVWRYESEFPILEGAHRGFFINPSPTVYDGVVYIGLADGKMHAIEIETGNNLWTFNTTADIKCTPALYDGILFFGSGHGGTHHDRHFYAVNITNGELVWKKEVIGDVVSSPSIKYGIVYFGVSNQVYALNHLDGSEVWSSTIPEGNYIESSPAVSDSALYISGGNWGFSDPPKGELYSFDLEDGEMRWSTGDYFTRISPSISGDIIYLGEYMTPDENGSIYAINSSSGEILWSYETGYVISSIPAITENRIIFAGGDGYLYSFVSAIPCTYSVSGMVFFSSTPLDNILVELTRDGEEIPIFSTNTSHGFYSFSNVTPELYWVTAYGPTPEYVPSTGYRVEVIDQNVTKNIDLPKLLTLLSPENKANVTTSRPTFEWEAFPNASRYSISVHEVSNWTWSVWEDSQSTNHTLQTELSDGKEYAWSIYAYDANDHLIGTALPWWGFTISIPTCVSIGSAVIAPGQVTEVPVNMSHVTKISGLGFDLYWDPEVINITNIKLSDDFTTNNSLTVGIDQVLGKAIVALVNTHAPDYLTWEEERPVIIVEIEAIGLPGTSSILDLEEVVITDAETWIPSPVSNIEDGMVTINIGSIHGYVTYSYNGAPMEGATVELSKYGSPLNTIVTGVDGEYEFLGIQLGEYNLTTSHDRVQVGFLYNTFWTASETIEIISGEIIEMNFSLIIRGDLNDNGEVDIGDVAKIANMYVGNIPEEVALTDFNGSGELDIGDVAKLANYYVENIDEV